MVSKVEHHIGNFCCFRNSDSAWNSGLKVRLVNGRPSFNFLVESDQKLKKLIFTTSLLDFQQWGEQDGTFAWYILKVWVYCFSMQVVMNKCFLLNPKKNFGADPSCHFWENILVSVHLIEKWRHFVSPKTLLRLGGGFELGFELGLG